MRITKILFLSLIFIIGLKVRNADAQAGKLAGYIYQFTKYIEWPVANKSGDFIIGVLGSTDMNTYLDELASTKKVVEQNIKIEKYNSVSEINKCHILFIVSEQSKNLAAVLSKVGSGRTLVIAEKPGLAADGAAINFVEKDGKLVFELNESSFSQHGLNVNSQLVNLAVKKY